MNADQFLTLERTVKSLRESYGKYLEVIQNPSVDKHSFKFGTDDRFAAFKTTVMLVTHTGYYGNSSCSSFLNFKDPKIVAEAFQAYLNAHLQVIMSWMADHIEEGAEAQKEEYIKGLKSELARLEESKVTA